MKKINSIKVIPARELVASELRKAILTGKFKAGQELKQDKIAEMLGVSRMPVREAIKILTDEGLVKSSPNKSAVVSEISTDYIKDYFEIRILLECNAVEKAINNLKDLSELENINEEYKEAVIEKNMEKARILNENFHITIWEAANNMKLKNLLSQLWNGLSLVSSGSDFTYLEHEELINAFKNMDIKSAKSIMKKHLNNSMKNILKNTN